MMNKSGIPYADFGWGPVTGCTKASEGCAHCYAESIARRFPDNFGGRIRFQWPVGRRY